MPVNNIPLVDPHDTSREVLGWAWGPRLTIDLTSPETAYVLIEIEVYHSEAAAYDGASRPVRKSILISGDGLKALLASNPTVFGAIAALVDEHIQADLGGTATPPSLPGWLATPDPED